MKEIALNIMDICINSLKAGASEIIIRIDEKSCPGEIIINIDDNGRGMDREMVELSADPFFTTGTKKKVGLGLPLLKQQALVTGGRFDIISEPGTGTKIMASFISNSIDRQPVGDLPGVISLLATSAEGTDIKFEYITTNGSWIMDTVEIKKELETDSLDNSRLRTYIKELIDYNIKILDPVK
ncbi:MAG: ATP-binding protein [Bacteroidales bacterium]|nr:ATP-binding protein [Bacteroidales bacterium]